jgi:hypothetical protein
MSDIEISFIIHHLVGTMIIMFFMDVLLGCSVSQVYIDWSFLLLYIVSFGVYSYSFVTNRFLSFFVYHFVW